MTRIERDRVAAVVEVQAGPHRLVSLMTAEAVDDLDLKVGDEAICTVKATNVVVEIPSARDRARDGSAGHPRGRSRRARRGLLERRGRECDLTTTERGVVGATIFAAASLKNMLAEAETAYEASHPGTDLTISTDSSAALATQIEQGAPADVFLSADTTNPRKLVDGGFARDAVPFAANTLTLIVPTDNPARIESPADLAKPGLRIIAAGDEVPITKYTTQLVENLAAEADDPEGFVADYIANVGRRRTTSAQSCPRSSSARAMQGLSTSPMPPHRTRSPRSRSWMRSTCRQPMRAWSSAHHRTMTRRLPSSAG